MNSLRPKKIAQLLVIGSVLLQGLTVLGQTKDTRAEIDIQAFVKEMTVFPDEKIRLMTGMGDVFYTDHIDSNWHYGDPVIAEGGGESSDDLERISFFNKDNAIVTGYIEGNKKHIKNGYYLTTDGGETWRRSEFGDAAWIYDAFVDNLGHAWMGGSSGHIYYSKDFGHHWDTLNSPFNSFTRLHTIFMADGNTGIAGALHNGIYRTSDNWKTHVKIPTPCDQKKYANRDKSGEDRIEKILFWNNLIVVDQNHHVFYTKRDTINWQRFPVKIREFELEPGTQTLFAVTDSFTVVEFSSPDRYQVCSDKRLSSYPKDLQVVNQSLFVLSNDDDVYKINKQGMVRRVLYTTDKKIPDPKLVVRGTNLTWGINGDQVYLRENTNPGWYRETELHFPADDIKLLNDSLAVLWDGVKNNYLYSLKNHSAEKYSPREPLQSFLSQKIKTLVITSGTQGCFHHYRDVVTYTRVDDSLVCNGFTSDNEDDRARAIFRKNIHEKRLSDILATINGEPSAYPTLSAFKITEKDKRNYLQLVDKDLKRREHYHLETNKTSEKPFYHSVPKMLDTLNSGILVEIFDRQENIWSTTDYWFTVQIVNESNDTLFISRNYSTETLPWNLPWTFAYNGINFKCYNIDFSRLLDDCIPSEFLNKEVFDNRHLIMEIANCLSEKKRDPGTED